MLKEEMEALRQIARRHQRSGKLTAGQTLKLVVNAALLHWDKLEPLFLSATDYSRTEGFACMELYRRGRLTDQFPARPRKRKPRAKK